MYAYGEDIYNNPKMHNLTQIDGLDEPDMSYSFTMLYAWLHEDGTVYYAEDSGCSCPSPFEDYTSLDYYNLYNSKHQDMGHLESMVKDFNSSNEEKRQFLNKVKAVWPKR